MASGSVPESVRDLARRVAWEAQIQGIPAATAAQRMASILRAAGYFLREGWNTLQAAAALARRMRLVGADAITAQSGTTLGQLQAGRGLPQEYAHVPVYVAVSYVDQAGRATTDYVTVIIDAPPATPIESILEAAVNQVLAGVPQQISPRLRGHQLNRVEAVGVGPVA